MRIGVATSSAILRVDQPTVDGGARAMARTGRAIETFAGDTGSLRQMVSPAGRGAKTMAVGRLVQGKEANNEAPQLGWDDVSRLWAKRRGPSFFTPRAGILTCQ